MGFEDIFKNYKKSKTDEKPKLSRLTKDERHILENLKPFIADYISDFLSDVSDIIIKHRLNKTLNDIQNVSDGKMQIGDREYVHFTSQELIEIFGGWFTLRYVFTIKNGKTETDYYICHRDYTGCDKKNLPPRNEAVFKKYGIETYGLTIIAPASAFD